MLPATLQPTTWPQTVRIMIFMADKHSLAIYLLYSMGLYLHSCIKLGLCSSEWDQIWNVDSWWHALDRNGELFLNTCIQLAKMMMSCVKNCTCQHSAGKSSPLMHCPCWDTHTTKIWASESKHKVSFIILKVAAGKGLGLVYRLSSTVPPGWCLFHSSSYCSFWDMVHSNPPKNVRGQWWSTLNNIHRSWPGKSHSWRH